MSKFRVKITDATIYCFDVEASDADEAKKIGVATVRAGEVADVDRNAYVWRHEVSFIASEPARDGYPAASSDSPSDPSS